MPERRAIELIGVKHEIQFVGTVEERLEKKLRQGQTLGLEISPDRLREYEQIFDELEVKKSQKYLEDALWARWAKANKFPSELTSLNHEQIKRLYGKTKIGERFEKIFLNEGFFYELFALARKKGIIIIPLDSPYGVSMAWRRAPPLGDLALTPVREKFMASRIIRLKPDYAVIGYLHVEGLKNLLKKRINVKTIYHYKPSKEERQTKRALRADYWKLARYKEKKPGLALLKKRLIIP